MIDVVGWLPREAALGLVHASDAALLLLDGPGSEINMSGELYNYVGRDRQVLAVFPEGDAAKVLRGLDWGVIVRPTIDGVARGIREVTAARPKRTVTDPEGRFDRVNLTSQFVAALERTATLRGADGDSQLERVK